MVCKLYQCGYWLARIFNPFYYLEKILPYLRPYGQAIYRLIVAMMPDRVPGTTPSRSELFGGYYFCQGFLAEHYGKVLLGLVGLTSSIFVFMYEEKRGF